jgi:hypothetical protein
VYGSGPIGGEGVEKRALRGTFGPKRDEPTRNEKKII